MECFFLCVFPSLDDKSSVLPFSFPHLACQRRAGHRGLWILQVFISRSFHLQVSHHISLWLIYIYIFLVKTESKCFLKINTFYFLLESFKTLIYRPFFLYSPLSLTSIQTDNRLCVSCFLENRCASAERWYSLSGSLLEEMNSKCTKEAHHAWSSP